MQISRFVKYAAGAIALAGLASAVAASAVAPIDRAAVPPSAKAGHVLTAQNRADRGAAADGFTPSEEVSAGAPVSFPADI